MDLAVRRVAALEGQLRPPSDKSLTHRAYMLAAVAQGESVITNQLVSQDCEHTLECMRQLGLKSESVSSTEVRLSSTGTWHQPSATLYCGNSGTTIRLLSGLVASRDMTTVLDGDESLQRRPMRRIAQPLTLMGAQVEGEMPPLIINGKDRLTAIDYRSPVASGQIKSCILLAGLRADGTTTVREPSLSRDHTERMLGALGVDVRSISGENESVATIVGGASLPGFKFNVPADISSAAFFLVAAAIVPGSQIQLFDVGINPTRTGIFDVLEQAGVTYTLENMRDELREPVADIEIRTPSLLQSFDIGGDLVPRLLDEIPVLAVLATQCDGVSTIRDASELRVKESDRIELIASNLRAMGATVEVFPDGLQIEGPVRLKAARIESGGDHRIAMAFAIAGLIADGETVIADAQNIATSYPDFEQHLWKLAVV
jgi:3-phosphoshikimate 1-carboxyvinyltransferase